MVMLLEPHQHCVGTIVPTAVALSLAQRDQHVLATGIEHRDTDFWPPRIGEEPVDAIAFEPVNVLIERLATDAKIGAHNRYVHWLAIDIRGDSTGKILTHSNSISGHDKSSATTNQVLPMS